MNKLKALFLLTLLATAPVAMADVFLMGSRIAAADPQATAEFYMEAFDLKEVNRLTMGNGQSEIMLNFGDTVETAMASSNAQIVIYPRASDAEATEVPHLIFQVTDLETMAESVTAAGGTLNGDIVQFGDTGILIVFATDPAGNQFEMIQFPGQ